MEIKSGLRGRAELVVGDELTAPSIGSGKVRVSVNVAKFDARVQRKLTRDT